MSGTAREERVTLPALRQRWDAACFLHWRYEASQVQALLPAGLAVEELEGSAWIGMVCFCTRHTSIGGVLPFPGGRVFPETNVRAYVTTPNGHDAVWFLTLEVANSAMARTGRLLRLPYRAASMSIEARDGTWRYESRRGEVFHHLVVRPGRELAGASLTTRDASLTGRWRAAIPLAPRRLVVPVAHEPWPLHDAELVALDESLLASLGLPAPASPPEVRFSPGVRASVGLPRPR